MFERKKVFLVLLGLMYSSVLALISYAFIMTEKILSHILWESVSQWLHVNFVYSLLVLTILCSVVIFLKIKWGNLPKTSHELLHEFKAKGTASYRKTWHSLLLALVILISGAGVGPEAPLLRAVIAYSIWQADKLRYLEANWNQLEKSNPIKWIKYIFHPSHYLLSYSINQKKIGKTWRNLLIANGLLAFWLMMRLTDQPSFVTKLGKTNWSMVDLLVFLPLCLYGFVFGKSYSWLKKVIFINLDHLKISLPFKICIGAMVIFLMKLFVPTLLFSGQHSLHTVAKLGMSTPVVMLFILSLIKLLFLDLCLWTGWTGGDIFPVTFAAFLQGFGMAQLFPQIDSLFVVLVVSVSIAITLLEKEWLAGIFISLFFPITLFPVSLLVIGLTILGRKIKMKFSRI